MKILYNTICWVRSFVFLPTFGRGTKRKMKNPAKPISFPYDRDKATQSILWLLHRHGGSMDKLKLVKLVFYADREHLARYGRPIVGGSYVAMRHGPVSSELLDQINEAVPEASLPFVTQNYHILAQGPVDEDELSESDIKVLEDINSTYGCYDPFTLRNLTHQLRAWKQHYPDPNVNTSYPLPYEAFFLDIKDNGILELVREDQEARDFLVS